MNVTRVRRPGTACRAPAHRLRLFAVSAAAAVVLSGCGGESRTSRHVVEITDFTFQPDTLRLAVGDTVVWVNRDVVPHTVTGSEWAWDSGVLATSASWTYVANVAGDATYICTLHPSMKGWMAVR